MCAMSDKTLSCSTVIIGAGTAGLQAYRELSPHDDRCLIVEAGPLGTFAQRAGEIPANILMAAALEVKAMSRLGEYGISMRGERDLDTSMVMNALRAVRARGTNEILTYLYRIEEHRRLIGRASFIDAHTLRVGETRIRFDTAIIATGATPAVPYDLASLGEVMTVGDIYELDDLPQSLAVFGTGATGLMVGQALAYLGTQVVVFASSGIWELTDDAVIGAACDLFQHNFNLELNARITEIEKLKRGYAIYYLDRDGFENCIHIGHILACNATMARTDGLNLRGLGIVTTPAGLIAVNPDTMQTTLPHIFAIGDVVNAHASGARSLSDARIAAAHARSFPQAAGVRRRDLRLSILHSDPPLAVVGLSFREMKARARGGQTFIACDGRMNDGLFRARRRDGGLIRMYTDERTHQVLGAEICGCGAESIAQFLGQCILEHKTIHDLEHLMLYRPSYEEIIAQVVEATLRVIRRKSQAALYDS